MRQALPIIALLFQGATHAAWPLEPETVFGIRLGEAIGAGSIPSCDRPTATNNYKHPTEMCIEAPPIFADRMSTLRAHPLREINSTASVFFEDARVSSINIDFGHDDYVKMRAILIERYGKPVNVETSSVTSKAGAKVNSETLTWRGVKNGVELIERSGSIDKSLVMFFNNDLRNAANRRIHKSIKDSAAKL